MLIAAALALLAGCTSPAGGAGQSTSAGGPAAVASSTSAPSAPSRTSASSGAPAEGTSSSQPQARTTTASAAALPGGAGDLAGLAASGDLTDDGRIDLHGRLGPEESADQPDADDLCAFLFGAPDEIGEITRLSSDLTLDPISGRHPAAGTEVDTPGSTAAGPSGTHDATVIACVYQADDQPVLALQVGDGPPVDPGLPGRPIIVNAGGLHAVLSYRPDHIGPTIDRATARAWLTEALARVAPVDAG